MVKDIINIGLLGCGTVGSGVMNIIKNNGAEIEGKIKTRLQIKKVLVRNLDKDRAAGLEGVQLTLDAEDIIADPDIQIIVEVMGGVDQSRDLIKRALRKGKYVVTANKDLLAQYGQELFQLASENGVNIFYEASVAGGIPIIRPLKHCLAANKILKIMGIINGTTNYILTRMTTLEMSYGDALKEAQEKGFAEQDPSSDVLGKDAAYKLAILASLAFNSSIEMDSIYTEGIDKVTLRDIRYAEELGYALKLLAIGDREQEGIVLRVHPTLIPQNHPLAAVNYEFNAIFLEGDAVGEIMLYGRGAGQMPTGSAVVADIIEAARLINHQVDNDMMEVEFAPKPVKHLSSHTSKFYLRLKAIDQPGVFASLSSLFGEEKVSLDMIIQKRKVEDTAEVVMVTHHIKEEYFFNALRKIEALSCIKEISQVIRVESGA
ncbi:homoserine dehydrogenase [Candidatus Contubernalis alkaliaceticus]|uniref:homoserine dehydrogenase n=1 Tax=Candidatus Contubernalis alkaliaceticus TaxID=338645 RepID=UPI001F4C07B4|nr:homoserine dehydrogenase [Candidatus Contubernalis alkalaceticus]UNC91431.1 homoserine dehydrogenase [Candidatus Contubernalis alkalaceticus]